MRGDPASGVVSYTVRRSTRARRSRLTITDDGTAVVVLPVRATEQEAGDLVARHRRWIDHHQRRIRERLVFRAARPQLAAGREILLRGEPHRVVALASTDGRARPSLRIDDRRIVIVTSPMEMRSTAQILEQWLRGFARADIEARVQTRSREMDIAAGRVTIRDQKTRWGSASRRGTLSFSWRLVMCPAYVLDYVVVHELAHLKVAGHSRAFWRLVDRHFADSLGARRWLRERGDELRHALD